MKYISTRGSISNKTFTDVILMGLAEDGGLMVPENYPNLNHEFLEKISVLSYQDLAFEIMKLFISDINNHDLKMVIDKTYTKKIFQDEEITPIQKIKENLFILKLSNGPTFAFKDIAMQFLGNLLEFLLKAKNQSLNIIGATSGDTGSAAEYAVRHKENINIFMLSPHNKMSAFQRMQMYSLQDKNIYNIALEGVFDDCQDIVKKLQLNKDFKNKYNISTVNSINWARIVAQTIYYFKAYFKVKEISKKNKISFSIPTGNFGNVFSGYLAKKMGLPIHRLIVSTNENDVLDIFFKKGIYHPRSPENTFITSSPSMDISKASNLERFIFDLLDRNTNKINELWNDINLGKEINLSDKLPLIKEYGFISGSSTHGDRVKTIKDIYENHNILIDPHTADGITTANRLQEENETIISLETALPIKFSDTINEALGKIYNFSKTYSKISTINNNNFKYQVLPNDFEKVKEYIIQKIENNN